MYNDFKCPSCKGYLRLGYSIILSAHGVDQIPALVMLHPEPGNYTVDYHPHTRFEKGDRVTFYCPICHHNLTSPEHNNLAMVLMLDDDGVEYKIYFSKIAGEHSTIKMLGEHYDLYGDESEYYEDLFNLSMIV